MQKQSRMQGQEGGGGGEEEEEEQGALERALNGGGECMGDGGLRVGGGDEDKDKSDSSLDLHTPLP